MAKARKIQRERLYTLRELSRLATVRRCVNTFRTWATTGSLSRSRQRVILETTIVSGTRHSSVEAFQRFLDALDR